MRMNEERARMNAAQNQATEPAAQTPPLPAALVDELKALTGRYPIKRGALLLMLNLIQDHRGHIAAGDMRLCADLVQLSAAEVYSVVSFYTMYRTRPGARFPIGVCRNIACWVNGAEQLTARVGAKLGIAAGETTKDGRFSLQEVECLGSCGTGPCLEIDSRYFENMDAARTTQLLDRLATADGDAKQAIADAERALRSGS
jgi:NADH-quinone oxidoreductase E subunit